MRHKPGLIVTRRPGELFVIEVPNGNETIRIQISCVEIDRNQTKLGVQCPREWNIYRGELRGEYLEHGANKPEPAY
jgi:sRNA-binding carbon storage regulator CsrA